MLSLRSMAFQNRSAAEMWLAQATELMQVQAATLFVLLCGGLVGPKKCKVFSAEVWWLLRSLGCCMVAALGRFLCPSAAVWFAPKSVWSFLQRCNVFWKEHTSELQSESVV